MIRISIGEFMSTKPITCHREDSIVEVSKLLTKFKIGSITVVYDDLVVGIITNDDIIGQVVAKGLDPNMIKANDIMTENVISITPKDTLENAIDVMNNTGMFHLPVIEERKLLGFVTVKDILRIEPALIEVFTEKLQDSKTERENFINKYIDDESGDREVFNKDFY